MFDTNKLNLYCTGCKRTFQVSFNREPGTYVCQVCGCTLVKLSPVFVTKEIDPQKPLQQQPLTPNDAIEEKDEPKPSATRTTIRTKRGRKA